mmetsp:Transcript_15610/g.23940  ORF Transcript_15610/g.23940 Transcript_15610/m.23940 type:complete len:201 (+) Transcript_15610:134-736(+)
MNKIVEHLSAEIEIPNQAPSEPEGLASLTPHNVSNQSQTRQTQGFALSQEIQRPNTQGTKARTRLKLNDILNASASPKSKVSPKGNSFNLKVALPTKETVSILKPKKRETAQLNFSQIEAASMRLESGHHFHGDDKEISSQLNTTHHLLSHQPKEQTDKVLSLKQLQQSEDSKPAKVTVMLNSQLTSFKSSARELDMFSN